MNIVSHIGLTTYILFSCVQLLWIFLCFLHSFPLDFLLGFSKIPNTNFICRWSAIAAKLPGRTDNEIKNYWHTHLKKRLMKENGEAIFEPKEQEIEASKSETNLKQRSNQITEFPSENRAILESAPLSPELSSSEFSSSLTYDYAVLRDKEWVIEDGNSTNSSALLAEAIGNFWTEPFLEDKSFNKNEFSSRMEEGEFFYPDSLYFDDGMDLLYQVLKDFPEM